MATWTLTIGDFTMLGLESQSKEDPRTLYRVAFIDGLTQETQIIKIPANAGEQGQLDVLNWWLNCDEDENAYKGLEEAGLKAPFLP